MCNSMNQRYFHRDVILYNGTKVMIKRIRAITFQKLWKLVSSAKPEVLWECERRILIERKIVVIEELKRVNEKVSQ